MYDMFADFRAFKPYRALRGITDGAYTRGGLFALLTAHNVDFSGFAFWGEITQTILDNYLNNTLRSCGLIDRVSEFIEYDKTDKIYKVKSSFPFEEIGDALIGDFVNLEGLFELMTADNLDILSYNDVDTNVYGKKEIVRDYDKVIIDVVNGQRQLTDVMGTQETEFDNKQYTDQTTYGAKHEETKTASRTNTQGGGTDTDTHAVMGFNSQQFSDADKNTKVYAQRQNTQGGGTDEFDTNQVIDSLQHGAHKDVTTAKTYTDTHTDAQSTDKSTTGERSDAETVKTYTDTLTHTKHIVMPREIWFNIQKEIADFDIYPEVRKIVSNIVCKGVW